MVEVPKKAAKKEKEKKQSPEARLEAMRYNHMMYGPTEGEIKMAPKKVNYGASYLKHPKFQSLMTAFRNGNAFKFDILTDGRLLTIGTDGSHISFDGKTLFYSRPLNKHEDNLFLDRASAVQHQTLDAAVHLVFAILRSFPELGEPELLYQHHKFFHGADALEFGSTEQTTNVMLGPFKSHKSPEKNKKP
jgi:hypothetical protein